MPRDRVVWSEITMRNIKEVKDKWKSIINSVVDSYRSTCVCEDGVKFRSHLVVCYTCIDYDCQWVEGAVIETWKEV